MALITCKIDQIDDKTVVTFHVHRIDPHDEVIMTSETPRAALEWVDDIPFKNGGDGKVLPLPHKDTDPQPLQVARTTGLSPKEVRCGVIGNYGEFHSWPGGGFPDTGT